MDPLALVEPLIVGAPAPFYGAVLSGAAASGVGEAFLAGYRAAIVSLVPSLAPPLRPSLAATERGPLHPREVSTALADGRVTGSKRYVTGLPGADRLVVLATEGTEGERKKLVAVIVASDASGVKVSPMPSAPFVPDVPHAEVDLTEAPVLERIAGDGWADVVRPFRTAEDIHVIGAVAGYLAGLGARAGWQGDGMLALLASLSSLSSLAAAPVASPAVHLALAGCLSQIRALLPGLPWDRCDPAEVARWQRDLPLLSVAERARAARTAHAWELLHQGESRRSRVST